MVSGGRERDGVVSDGWVIHALEVETETWSDTVRGDVSFRTVTGDRRSAPELTAGVSELAPGGWLGHHRHDPAELYYVIEGNGLLTLAGEEHPVAAGSVAYIPGNIGHGIRNTGTGALRFFFVFPVGSMADVEYRFSHDPGR